MSVDHQTSIALVRVLRARKNIAALRVGNTAHAGKERLFLLNFLRCISPRKDRAALGILLALSVRPEQHIVELIFPRIEREVQESLVNEVQPRI